MVNDKYMKLYEYLKSIPEAQIRAELTIEEIEKILGEALPVSAHRYPTWWTNNENHMQAKAWLRAGWTVKEINLLEKRVTLTRRGQT